jgi:HSP20 family protein
MIARLPFWRGWPLLHSPIRIEEYADYGSHVVRAQLPGIDPAKDVAVMIADNELIIDVKRPMRFPSPVDSEFRYGSQRRTILLPRGAKDDTLTATYDGDGILEVMVEMTRPAPIGRTVPIRRR